jgi:ABC-type multidrug transport system fused ATPase/permease subunit
MHHGKRKRFRHIFLAHVLRVKWRLAFAGLCTLGVAAADLLKPWPLKIIIDHGLLDKPLPRFLDFLSGAVASGKVALVAEASCAIVLLALCAGLFSYAQIFITSSLGYRMVYSLRRELFAHLQRLSLSFHNHARSGDLMTKISGDTNTLKDVFAESILKFSAQALEIIGMFGILFLVNWRMGLIPLATLPFLGFSLFHLYRKTKASVKKQKRQESRVASRMTEVLSAIPLVQAFAREKYEEEKFDAATTVTLQESIRIARLEAAATRSSQIITAVGTAGAVWFGALQVLQGRMLPGELVLVVAYLNNLYKPMRQLAKLSTDFSKAMASAERISEVLDIEPEIQDRPGAIEAPPLQGRILFDRVSFDYGDGKDVLKDVSFLVSPGQGLALVGASGAGKSTIASLILRLYETQEGAILIDGVNVRKYRRESLRRQIAIVLQNSLLFGATIRENIAYGKPEAGEEEIIAAANAANADEFIRELENGYDTVIGERGATLSGGQRQRIAIARALIRDAPILILDEPMTGLDVESEAKVREALDRLMKGRTCLMITHDLQAIANADLVLVIEAGEIVERGKHDELMATSGRYRQLYELNLLQPGHGREAELNYWTFRQLHEPSLLQSLEPSPAGIAN